MHIVVRTCLGGVSLAFIIGAEAVAPHLRPPIIHPTERRTEEHDTKNNQENGARGGVCLRCTAIVDVHGLLHGLCFDVVADGSHADTGAARSVGHLCPEFKVQSSRSCCKTVLV